jgi:hypothetical protein
LYQNKSIVAMEKFLKNSGVYGLILGGISVIYSMILYISGINILNIIFGIFNFVFLIGLTGFITFYGTKNYREKYSEGYITYGKALLSCLLIGVFAAVISAVYTFIYFKSVDTAYFDAMINKFMAKMEANPNIPAAKLDEIYKNMTEGFHKPAIKQALQSFVFNAIAGGLVGLIAAAIVKKERPLFE